MQRHRGGLTLNRVVLLIADIVLLILFAFIGQQEHHTYTGPLSLLKTAAPFILTWVILGFIAGLYKMDTYRSVGSMLKRTLPVWLITAPVAILLRMQIEQESVFPTPFLIVPYITTLILLIGWRFYVVWSVKRRR
jgi:hypothetical protein